MHTPFAAMSIDQLAAIAQESTAALPNHTIVMPGRVLAPQDEPQPQVQASIVPPPPAAKVVPSGSRKGRVKMVDTTDITQLPVIARRCPRAYEISTDESGNVAYNRISKPASLAIVNYLESLGNPVVRNVNLAIAEDGVEVLVFG